MHRIVLLSHGESAWDSESRFTGWADPGLSGPGCEQARAAGRRLRAGGFAFDMAHTSVLGRAIKTLWLALEEMDSMWTPVHHAWHLNERHWGALQGLTRAEAAARHGEGEVQAWLGSYDSAPPALDAGDPRSARADRRYALLADEEIPLAESLRDTVARVVPYWNNVIAPGLREGRRMIIVAHGGSLRALARYLDNIGDEAVAGLDIPAGVPQVYELDAALRPVRHYSLGDQGKAG